MNLQTKDHGHTSLYEPQMHMAVMDLVLALFVVFLVVQLHPQQLEAIIYTRMNKKLYYLKRLRVKLFLYGKNNLSN
jgi:hypothetical protein